MSKIKENSSKSENDSSSASKSSKKNKSSKKDKKSKIKTPEFVENSQNVYSSAANQPEPTKNEEFVQEPAKPIDPVQPKVPETPKAQQIEQPSAQPSEQPSALQVPKVNISDIPKTNFNTTLLLGRIIKELHYFTDKKYASLLSSIILHLKFMSIPQLVAIWGKLKYLQNMKPDCDLRELWLEKIKLLLNSLNVIKDADVHHFGVEISIDFQQASSQAVLNVKRLVTDEKINEILDTGDRYAGTRELPTCLDRTNLHENVKITWIRVCLVENCNIQDVVREAVARDIKFVKYYKFNDTVIEMYFNNNPCCFDIMRFVHYSPHIKRLIFYSNCKTFKKFCTQPYAVMSNTLKFYYCNATSNVDFDVTTIKQLSSLSSYLILSVLFLMKNNLKTIGGEATTTPLTTFSGVNPRLAIQKKSYVLEDLSSYDRACIDGQRDLRVHTSISDCSYDNGERRHKLYEVSSDRDARLLLGGSHAGGRNRHELLFTLKNTDECSEESEPSSNRSLSPPTTSKQARAQLMDWTSQIDDVEIPHKKKKYN